MWIERDCYRACILRARALHDLRKHVAMGAMDAIEITDADDGRSEVFGDFAELAEDLHLDFKLQLQAIVGELYAGRKVAVGFCVAEIVAYVRKKSSLGLEPSGDTQGVFDVRVGWVWLVAKSIEKQDVEAGEFFQ